MNSLSLTPKGISSFMNVQSTILALGYHYSFVLLSFGGKEHITCNIFAYVILDLILFYHQRNSISYKDDLHYFVRFTIY